ncbi:site-specific integrase [Collimonas pratensis]|uniref:Phage integrase family protein n=1 Tax=Collimonas pratensis TaxID=279113 RepID=A0A127Q738_9BURK|nr:site-specific integrase [Collimonas pratensis]AMP05786.1 phage integrase family protein [Collimonas pratensis]
MGRGRKGSGIEIRESAIRVSFTWRGIRCRETLDLKPTAPNIKFAERMVEQIKRKMELGSFVYGEFFPNSPNAEKMGSVVRSFEAMSDLWLQTKGRLAAATLSQYSLALKFWQSKLGADSAIESLSYGKIAAVVGSHPWPSAKLCNNYLIPLRGVFALAGREISHLVNPMQGIENGKHQKAVPDPLSTEEMEWILSHMREHYDLRIANYFEFAFMTGMRPEELIALRWGDVDWNHGTARVERARTFKGQLKSLKTHEIRDVDLVERAMTVLQAQKAFTFLKSDEIFENPVTLRPWHDERSQRDHYWRPTLKRLGIRMRRAYQTRHTYATTALMAGVNPTYISRQMGHANAKMLFTVYAKWIYSADRGREKAKMEAVLRFHFTDIHIQTNSNLSRICPSIPANPENTGRHDWTRTNLRPPFGALSQRRHRRAYPIIALKYPRKTHKKTTDWKGNRGAAWAKNTNDVSMPGLPPLYLSHSPVECGNDSTAIAKNFQSRCTFLTTSISEHLLGPKHFKGSGSDSFTIDHPAQCSPSTSHMSI